MEFRNIKVYNLYNFTIFRDEDIIRFDITMADTLNMEVIDADDDLFEDA